MSGTMTGLTLYTIEDHLAALQESIDTSSCDEELAQEFQQALKTAVEKRDRVGQFLAHLDNQITFAEAEIDRLRRRKQSFEKVRERVEEYVRRTIESLGCDESGRYKKLEGKTITFSLRACPPSVEVTDLDALPPEYKTLTLKMPAQLWEDMSATFNHNIADQVQQHVALREITPDKRAIKANIDSGGEISGADLTIGKFALVRR
jgi:hypothetical protein